MVWQDGETMVGNQELLRLRLQIVSDNLVFKKLIPPMVHVLILPGAGGEAAGTRLRSIQCDTVSERYGRYLLTEVLPDVEKSDKLRKDAYCRRFLRSDLRHERCLEFSGAVQPGALAHWQLLSPAMAAGATRGGWLHRVP